VLLLTEPMCCSDAAITARSGVLLISNTSMHVKWSVISVRLT
jgi:hypothetical protein